MNDVINKIIKTNFGCIAVICVLVFLSYGFVLSATFKTMDDSASIVENRAIKSLEHIDIIFKNSFFGGNVYYRPLVSFSFMLEYHFFKLNAFYYYLTNLFLHIAIAISVFLLLEIIFKRRLTAFFIALLFAVHPVHWEAVSNIPGRAILLSAFFTINTFRLFCLGKKNKLLYLLSLLLFIPALLSKESSAMLPLILLSYQFFLDRKPNDKWMSVVKPVLPFFLVEAVYVVIRRSLGITKLFLWRSLTESILGFLSFLRSVMTNLRIFFLPFDLQFDRSQALFMNFLNGQVAMTVAFYLIIIFLLWKFRKRLSAKVLFFLSWFWIELIPVSQIVASIGVQPGYISTAEHFFYVPSIGVFVFSVMFVSFLYKQNKEKKIISAKIFQFIVVSIYSLFILVTIQQSIYSSHETAMLNRSLELNPTNVRIRYNLAVSHAKRGHYKDAEREFREVVARAPYAVKARIGLGKALCDQEKFWEGLKEYGKIADADNLQELLDNNLKATYAVLTQKYQDRIKEEPDNAQAHYTLGVVYSLDKKYKKAAQKYKDAISLKPGYEEAIFNLAASYEALEDFEQAMDYYKRVVKGRGEAGLVYQSYFGLSRLYQRFGNMEEAKRYQTLAEDFKNSKIKK